MARPAEQLVGLKLADDWTVVSQIPKSPNQTGGTFSTSYLVKSSDGAEAFLKAMDYQDALKSPDPATTLNAMTNAYLFERNLLRLCKEKRLSRVVRAITDGKVIVSEQPVEYLIFELADGDIRKHLSELQQFDLAWRLRCIHNIFVGGQQLNNAQIAHQDLKPSNVLNYGTRGQKLADLGRAWYKAAPSPFDGLLCAGDRHYAPPELLYQGDPINLPDRRFSTDFYLLGSMVFFMFSGIQVTAALILKLAPEYRPTQWAGTYGEALPYLNHAFFEVLRELQRSIPNPKLADELSDIVEQMCNPDVQVRGDRLHKAKIGSRFNLQRLVQRVDRLSREAEIGILTVQ